MSQKNEERFTPVPNNYCGGFALDAVLTEVRGSIVNPKGTYDEIMKKQTDLDKYSASYKYIQNTLKPPTGNTTEISLPSSIALVAKEKGLEVRVLYYKTLKEEPNFKHLIGEEVERLGEMVVEVKTDDFWGSVNKEADNFTYFIVLVRNAHWVAVKKTEKNEFDCYDPGDGKCSIMESIPRIDAAIQQFYRNKGNTPPKVNELVIALK